MRKYLFVALCLFVIVGLTACKKDNDDPTPESSTSHPTGDYVAKGQTQSPYAGTVYTANNVWMTADTTDSTLKLTIFQVKFVPQMPLTLTFSLPGVPYEKQGDVIIYQADSIVPQMGSVPTPKYMARNVNGRITQDSLLFSSSFGDKYSCIFGGKLLK